MLGTACGVNLRIRKVFRIRCSGSSADLGSEFRSLKVFPRAGGDNGDGLGDVDDVCPRSFFWPVVFVPRRWRRYNIVYKKFREDKEKSKKPTTEKNLDVIRTYRSCLTVDEKGKSLGIMSSFSALEEARKRNYDLVLMRSGDPPVCKFVEIPKVSIDEEMKMRSNRRPLNERKPLVKGVAVTRDKVKEVRISDSISEHDFQIKVQIMRKLLKDRYRVKVVLVFKKREDFDMTLAHEIMENVAARLSDISHLESQLKFTNLTGVTIFKPTGGTLSEAAKNEKEQREERQKEYTWKSEQMKENTKKYQKVLENNDNAEKWNKRMEAQPRNPQKQFIEFLSEFGLTTRSLPDRETLAKLLEIKVQRDEMKESGLKIPNQIPAIPTNQKVNIYNSKKNERVLEEVKGDEDKVKGDEDKFTGEDYDEETINELLESLKVEEEQGPEKKLAKLRSKSKKVKTPAKSGKSSKKLSR